MVFGRKIVLHSRHGYRDELDSLVADFIRDEVVFVAVLGVDASRVEDIVDELCVGDGSSPYTMLTSSHEGESLKEVIEFVESLTGEYAGPIQVVEL